MPSLTLNLPPLRPELEACVCETAHAHGISLVEAAVLLMCRGASLGVPESDTDCATLLPSSVHVLEAWTSDEEAQLRDEVGLFEQIDGQPGR